MNIGIVTTWFERGASYVSRQYRDTLSLNNNVYIYARGGEEYAFNNETWDKEYVTWGKKSINPVDTAIDIPDFDNWLQKNSIELVFFNEQQCWEPIIFCNKKGLKTGAYIDYYTEETIPLFALYDFLICNTKRHYSAFSWHPQCSYVPWGTDIYLFNNNYFAPVNEGKITFFHSAGMNPIRKGTDSVIRAFQRLNGNSKLIIHSQVNLKEWLPDLSNDITSLEQSGKLECIRKTITAPGLYHLGDVYVYPSKLDGIGLTIIEALACGLPVITSNYAPMNEFVNNESGKLIEISYLYARSDGYFWPQCKIDENSLISCMNYYVKNISKIKDFKIQARRYAECYLDWQRNSVELHEIFYKVKCIKKDSDLIWRALNYDRKRNWLSRLYYDYPCIYRIVYYANRIKK